MSSGSQSAALTAVESLLTELLSFDASGRTWLPQLLEAAPNSRARLGDLVDAPGSLAMTLSVRGASGRLACFEYPVPPSPELTDFLITHPEHLDWPPEADMTDETARLRRMLIDDDPPGSRARAQERAREMARASSALARTWWRFENLTHLDCLLMTDRLLITVLAPPSEPTARSTEWLPRRTRLVRALEAARQLAHDRAWASLVVTDRASNPGLDVERLVAEGTPHLDEPQRRELARAFLGSIPLERARSAVQG